MSKIPMASRLRLASWLAGALALAQVPAACRAVAEPSARPVDDAPAADTRDSLERQLAAQRAINEQLQARVAALEQQLEAGRTTDAPLLAGLDANAPPPPAAPDDRSTAIEEALSSKGLVLLPAGDFRLTPSIAWAHSGSGSEAEELYAETLTLEAGLPWGMAASLRLPYVQRDAPAGGNTGLGDLTVSLSKRLTADGPTWPSLVLRLSYEHDNGKDAFGPVPIGDGFRALTARLLAVKRVEPLALYGGLSYRHAWSAEARYLDGGVVRTAELEPADLFGVGLGVSLAATPDISLDAGVSLDFSGSDRLVPADGEVRQGSRSTAGYIALGADFVLRKDLFLSLSAAAGVTDDASDFIFSMALPYRF